jgi:hypothetical protein
MTRRSSTPRPFILKDPNVNHDHRDIRNSKHNNNSMQKDLTPMSSPAMSNTRLAVEQSDTNIVPNASKADSTDMTDSVYKHALNRAKADAMETAAALENLVDGIQAVKRILEHPIDNMEDYDNIISVGESSDAELVSKLSNKLVGVLGSELIGLLNAAQMTKGHAKLRIEDDTKAIQDLHRAREFAHELHHRADRAESISLRLKAEKKLLVREVRSLQGDRQLLVKQVKSMRKMLHRTKQFDAWRHMEDHLRAATIVHESVLTNKTFTSGFARIDPPGTKGTKDSDMQDRNNNNHENDFTRVSLTSEKENNVQHAYFPRKDGDEEANNSMDRVLNYTNGTCSSNSKPSQSKPTPKSKSNSTPSKQLGLSFPTGISNSLSTGLGRFKNVLQEANNNIRDQHSHHKDHGRTEADNYCQDQKQQLPPPRNNQKRPEESLVETRNDNNCKLMDDEATKSTKSCSFEIDATMNLSTSIISCSDDEMTNDLVFQISIDERSSFLNNGCSHRLGHTSFPPTLMITPESSPLGQSANEFLKPICNPKVLRTLAIPNATTREKTRETFPSLKPRLRSFHVGP